MLDDGDVDALAEKKGSVVMAKRVRRKVREFGLYDSMKKSRIRPVAFNSENKWRAGGCWPCFTVAIDLICEEPVGHVEDPGVAVLESPDVKLYHSVRGNDVVLREVANFLVSSSSEEERCDHYDAAERVRIARAFLLELPDLFKPADDEVSMYNFQESPIQPGRRKAGRVKGVK